MSRIEFAKSGISYSETRDTPFGPSSFLTTIPWKEWIAKKQPIELLINDIGVESDSGGRIEKVWLEVSNFRLVGNAGSNIATSTPLKPPAQGLVAAPENLSQDQFMERAKRQLAKGEGQAVDILVCIKQKPGMTREEVCDAIGASHRSGAVGENLKVLQMMGKIYSDKKGGKSRYFVALEVGGASQ